MTLSFFDDDDARQQQQQSGVVFLFFFAKNVFSFWIFKTQKNTNFGAMMMISFASASSWKASFREEGIKKNTQKHPFSSYSSSSSEQRRQEELFPRSFKSSSILVMCGFEVIFFPFDERSNKLSS